MKKNIQVNLIVGFFLLAFMGCFIWAQTIAFQSTERNLDLISKLESEAGKPVSFSELPAGTYAINKEDNIYLNGRYYCLPKPKKTSHIEINTTLESYGDKDIVKIAPRITDPFYCYCTVNNDSSPFDSTEYKLNKKDIELIKYCADHPPTFNTMQSSVVQKYTNGTYQLYKFGVFGP